MSDERQLARMAVVGAESRIQTNPIRSTSLQLQLRFSQAKTAWMDESSPSGWYRSR